MKQAVTTLIVGILLGAAGAHFVGGGAASTPGSPPKLEAKAAAALPDLPKPYYEVLYENDAVRVVSHRLESGASEPEHTHPPMVGYFVEGATLVVTEADGSSREETLPNGAFVEIAAWWTHSMTNSGDTSLHSILVEFKDAPTEEVQ